MKLSLSINGEAGFLAAACSIADALSEWGYGNEMVAVALNGEFVPRSNWSQLLSENDSVEIVTAVEGG